MSNRARMFRSTASVAATMHPWITPPNWLDRGVFFGCEMRTGRVVFIDFQLLKLMRLIHSMVILILGAKDHGKSTLTKSLSLRLLCLQYGIDPETGLPVEARGRFHDRKRIKGVGEYSAVIEYLVGVVIRLADLGLINLFDHKVGMTELDMLESALNVGQDIRGHRPHRWGTLATQSAVHKMNSKSRELASPGTLEAILRTQTMEDLLDYFEHVNNSLRKEYEERIKDNPLLAKQLDLILTAPHNVPEDEYRHDSGIESTVYGELLRSRFGKTFGNTTSLYDVMTSPVASFDWTGMTGAASSMLETHLTNIQRIAMERGLHFLNPHVNTKDEEATEIKSLVHARVDDEFVRKARSYPTTDIRVAHFDTDLLNVGEEGSELRGLGQSIFKGLGMIIYGRQEPDEDTMHRMTLRGISEEDAWQTTQLPMGCWGLHVPGEKMRFVQHVLLPSEVPLMQTNQANEDATNRVPVSSMPHIQERIEALGAITIGAEV